MRYLSSTSGYGMESLSTEGTGLPSGPAWAIDAAAAIACPISIAQWTALFSSAGVTDWNAVGIWLQQEASGNLVDSSGNGLTLAASGTGCTYNSSLGGWTRNGLAMADRASGYFFSTAAGLPNIGTDNAILMSWVKTSASAFTYNNMQLVGGSGTAALSWNRASPTGMGFQAGSNYVENTTAVDGSSRPQIIQIDRTGSQARQITNAAIINPAWDSGLTGKGIVICGGQSHGAALATWVYSVLFKPTGSVSTANIKTVLQKCGWGSFGW